MEVMLLGVLPESVKNIELPEAMKKLNISNSVRNVPTTVTNNVPESVGFRFPHVTEDKFPLPAFS
jgi:hypothetical protein